MGLRVFEVRSTFILPFLWSSCTGITSLRLNDVGFFINMEISEIEEPEVWLRHENKATSYWEIYTLMLFLFSFTLFLLIDQFLYRKLNGFSCNDSFRLVEYLFQRCGWFLNLSRSSHFLYLLNFLFYISVLCFRGRKTETVLIFILHH